MLQSVALLALLAVFPPLQAQYDENFARNMMFPIAAAAYADNPQVCLTNKVMGQLKRKLIVKCDSTNTDTCIGYTAVSQSNQAIIISFKGTDQFLQLIEEGTGTVFDDMINFAGGGAVSAYFNNGFMALWNGGMKDDFLSLAAQFPSYELWITGHSLGGAMASLCAQLVSSFKLFDASKIKLVTFGQPRTGNSMYAKVHDQLVSWKRKMLTAQVPNSIRVTHHRDVVPHIPPEGLEDYEHHKQEVWYKDGMKPGDSFVVCQLDEDTNCSDGLLITLSVDDHLHYFEQSVFDIGNQGCV